LLSGKEAVNRALVLYALVTQASSSPPSFALLQPRHQDDANGGDPVIALILEALLVAYLNYAEDRLLRQGPAYERRGSR
jgi:hypothetical protein